MTTPCAAAGIDDSRSASPTPAGTGEAGIGRIAHRTFLGEKTDYEITLGSTTLQVTRSDSFRGPALEVGDAVRMSVDPTRIHVLG